MLPEGGEVINKCEKGERGACGQNRNPLYENKDFIVDVESQTFHLREKCPD